MNLTLITKTVATLNNDMCNCEFYVLLEVTCEATVALNPCDHDRVVTYSHSFKGGFVFEVINSKILTTSCEENVKCSWYERIRVL